MTNNIAARVLAPVVVLVGLTLPVGAQQPLTLSIQDGRVTLRAQNVAVRTILAEWSRIGGTTVVNGDRIVGAPVTLELNSVPERDAIDIVLRGVAGYVLGARASAAGGASSFDRIFILPVSVAPRTAAAAPAFTQPARVPSSPTDLGDAQDDGPESSQAGQAAQPVRTAPMRPGGPPNVPQQFGPITPRPDVDDTQPPVTEPRTFTIEPQPGNPFGVPAGSSTAPGVVTPAPQQGQPSQ